MSRFNGRPGLDVFDVLGVILSALVFAYAFALVVTVLLSAGV